MKGLFDFKERLGMSVRTPTERHYAPKNWSDRIAYAFSEAWMALNASRSVLVVATAALSNDYFRERCMAARIAVILLAGLMTGCAGVPSTSPGPPVREAAASAPPVSPASAPGKSEPKAPPSAKAPAASKAPAAPAAVPREPVVAARKSEAAPPVAAKPEGPPPLDLKSLEQRLKETNAIGVLTKLSLKNQVDDLLEQFRDYYQGTNQDHARRVAAGV